MELGGGGGNWGYLGQLLLGMCLADLSELPRQTHEFLITFGQM